MIVTFVDGSWTDNLSIEQYTLHEDGDGLTLTIEVAPRAARGKAGVVRKALAELVDKRLTIHTIQIGKPQFTSRLWQRMRQRDSARLGLKLSVKGVSVAYPAGVVFDPDAITLNLG